MPNKQYRLTEEEARLIKKHRDKEQRRVLVLPDLHAPFIIPEFLEFAKEIYNKYSCNRVHFTGDLLDNSFSSFHIISRKFVKAGLSEYWLKDFNDVLGTPGWIWQDSFNIDGVRYIHGTGSSGRNGAISRAINWNTNICQGHIHTETSIIYHANNDRLIWSMQLGAAFDSNSYAASYAKNFTKKPIVAVGVILDNGKLPILEPMPL